MECWRYYYALNSIPRSWTPIGVGSMISSTTHRMNFQIPIPCSLRVPPTITQVNEVRSSVPDGSIVIKMNENGLDSIRDGMVLIYFKPAETLTDYGFGNILIACFEHSTDNILLDSEIYS